MIKEFFMRKREWRNCLGKEFWKVKTNPNSDGRTDRLSSGLAVSRQGKFWHAFPFLFTNNVTLFVFKFAACRMNRTGRKSQSKRFFQTNLVYFVFVTFRNNVFDIDNQLKNLASLYSNWVLFCFALNVFVLFPMAEAPLTIRAIRLYKKVEKQL